MMDANEAYVRKAAQRDRSPMRPPLPPNRHTMLLIFAGIVGAGVGIGIVMTLLSPSTISIQAGTWIVNPSDGSYVCRVDVPLRNQPRWRLMESGFWQTVCTDWEGSRPEHGERPRWVSRGWAMQPVVHTAGGWR